MNDKPFNKLTPAEAERLDLIQEECAEVIQIISKIKRHGYDSFNPTVEGCPGNRALLAMEIGHLHFVIGLSERNKDFDTMTVLDSVTDKQESIGKYLHHNSVTDNS